MRLVMRIFVCLVAVLGVAAGIYLAVSRSGGKPAQDSEQALAAARLDSDKERAIWAAEHNTFEIERRFGPAFLQALVAGDSVRLDSFLFDDASCGDQTATAPRQVGNGQLRVEKWETEDSVRPLSRDDWAAGLVAQAAMFQKVTSSRLRVLEITADPPPGQWTTSLLLTLTGRDDQNVLLQFESHSQVVFQVQDEQQLASRPSIRSWSTRSKRLRAAQRTLMKEVTRQSGLDRMPLADNWKLSVNEARLQQFQMAVADYDRDGHLDIAVSPLAGRPLLLRGRGQMRFDEVGRRARLASVPGGTLRRQFLATWIDYDDDGYPDLICGSRLYHNDSGSRFTDVTANSGLEFSTEPMGCVVADYDCDGLLDLYVLYQEVPDGNRGETKRPQWVDDSTVGRDNHLWHNEGGGRFRNVTASSRAGGGRRDSFAAAWLHYDDDHWPDLYVANDFGRNVLLRNRGDGTFQDISDRCGADGFATSMGVAIGDVNNDGRSDVYVANMYSKMGRRIIGMVGADDYPDGIYSQIQGSCAGNRLYLRSGSDSPFADHSASMGVNAVGWAYAPVMFDVDNDGFLDMYATTGFMSFDRKKPDG